MPLTQTTVANELTSFFDSVAGQIAEKVVNAALPLIGTIGDAAAADPFGALKTALLDAVNGAAGADVAQAIVDAVNALGITGVSAAKTPEGGIALALQTDTSTTTGVREIDVGESIGDFFEFKVNSGATVTAALQATLLFDVDGAFSLADTGVPELTVGVDVDFDIANLDADLGVAKVQLSDTNSTEPEFSADFGFDLALDAGGGFAITPTLTAQVGLDVQFETTDVLAGFLPNMRGDFIVAFGTADGAFQAPTISVDNVQVDLGSYLGIARDVFDDLADIFNSTPFNTLIDIATQPIPGLNDLASQFGLLGPPVGLDPVGGLFGDGDGIVTIGDLAAKANTGLEPDIDRFYQAIDIIQKIRQLGAIADAGYIDFGGGTLVGGATVPDMDPAAILSQLTDALVDLGLSQDVINFLTEVEVSGLPGAAQPPSNGFTFGLFENPADVLKILLTKEPVDLVTFDVPGYKMDETYGGFFPVLGPLGFLLEGRVRANINLDIGYDTYGIISGNLLEGFFITTPEEQRPAEFFPGQYWDNPEDLAHMPAGALKTSLTGGAGVGFAGSSITVNANFQLGVYAYLEGADGDGKFRPVAEGFDCIFEPVGGSADVSVRLSFEIGFDPFSITKHISLAEANLGDFTVFKCPPPTVEATPEAPGLATLISPDLLLNVGARADLRKIVDEYDGVAKQVVNANNPLAESYVIGLARDEGDAINPLDNPPPVLVPGKLDVHAFGFTQRIDELPTLIKADFGAGDDQLVIQRDVAIDSEVFGGDGFDVLIGGAGRDMLSGDGDADILTGNDNDDDLLGGAGDDQLDGGKGADLLDGGDGIDTVDYSQSNRDLGIGVKVTITPAGGIFGSGGDAQGDELISIESITGTDYADDLRAGAGILAKLVFDGGRGNDTLIGGDGNDFLLGGAGADHLNGDPGFDGTSYVMSWGSVDVDLARTRQRGGDAQGDDLFSMEAVEGSVFGDTLLGNAVDNTLVGNDGDDTLEGRGGADSVIAGRGRDIVFAGADDDTLDGGPGIDTLSYEHVTGPVTVDLGRTQVEAGLIDVFDPSAAPDNIVMARPLVGTTRGISTFENLIGTGFADTLIGDVADNRIEGRNGNDTIRGDAGFDVLVGGFGADILDGGNGFDWIYYDDSPTGVFVDVVSNLASNGTAQGDTFSSVENILGSRFADDLRGNGTDNIIDPNISGATVTEVVRGYAGSDTLRLDYSGVSADIGQGIVGGFGPNYDGSGFFTRLTLAGGALDTVNFIEMERLDIVGTRASDVIDGAYGADIIVTGAGDDFIRSGNGADHVDAGSGDDFVAYNLRPTSIFDEGPPIFGYGLSTFYLEGGLGIDTLSVALDGATENLFIIGGTDAREAGVNFTLANGAAARGFERLATVRTGSGADTVMQLGIVSNNFQTDGAEDHILPGLGFDFVDGGSDFTEGREVLTGTLPWGGFGTRVLDSQAFAQNDGDLLSLDYSDYQGAGGITGTVQEQPLDYLTGQILFAGGGDGAFLVRNWEFSTNSGHYADTGGDVDLSFSNIERLIVNGSAQGDYFEGTDNSYRDFLDYQLGQAEALPGLSLLQGEALLAENLRGDDFLGGAGGNDVLIGKTGSDLLLGGDGDDILIGSSPDFYSMTSDGDGAFPRSSDRGEIDTLAGGAGADTFVLGLTIDYEGGLTGYFYASTASESLPDTNRAIIADFNPLEDTIQLSGDASYYTTELVNAGTPDVATVIYHSNAEGPQLIAELKGVTSFDLNASYVTYSTLANPGVGGIGGFPAAPAAIASIASASMMSTSEESAFGAQSALTSLAAASWVQQNGDVATLKAALDGATGGGGSTLTLSGSAASFGTFDGDPFGLGKGIILSTGDVAELPGVNLVDTGAAPPLSIPLVFTEVITAEGNRLYRAELTGLDIKSLTLTDSNSKLGGSGGAASGFDIDAMVISNTLLTSVNSSVDLNNAAVLPRLDVLDYSNANLFFNPGSQRAPNSLIDYAADTIGSANGLVNNAFAQLETFTLAGNASALVLGDGGSLGFNLAAPLDTSQPVYLYIGEVGRTSTAEILTGLVTASPTFIQPDGDLSTDLGAQGLDGDTASLVYTFTPGAGDTAFSLDVVLFSEELPEFDGAVNLTDIYSIKLNGVEIGALSNGATMSLQSLIYSGSGDLILNPVGTGPLADQIKADAFTKTLTISGAVIPNAVNTLTIEVRDGRDALLDSGLLIKDGSFKTFKAAAFDFNLHGGQAEAGGPSLKIDISLPEGLVLTEPVTVTVDPDPDIDLGNGPGEPIDLVFTPGGPTTQQLTIEVPPDADVDVDGMLQFKVKSPDPAFDGLDLAPVAIDIIPIIEGPPQVTVEKSAPANVNEGTADPSFTFTVGASAANAVSDPVTITAITDDKLSVADNVALFAAALAAYQALPGRAGATEIVLAPGESFTFSFDPSGTLLLDAGTPYENTVTVTGEDDEGLVATATDNAIIDALNVDPSLNVVKTASATLVQAGRPTITFTYAVSNTSSAGAADPLSNVLLRDDNGTARLTDDLIPTFVSGDANANSLLDVGETWIYSASSTFTLRPAASRTNTVQASATDDEGVGATATDDATVSALPGPGVRTPGYWGSKDGLTFWDGKAGVAKSGPAFPAGELAPLGPLASTYLILGGDHDNILETGELAVSLKDAQSLVSANAKDQQDARWVLLRDVIATELDIRAGNPATDGNPATVDPQHLLQDAVAWLEIFADRQNDNQDIITLTELTAATAVRTSNAQWTANQSGLDHTALQLHSLLDEYNNFGTVQNVVFANDADWIV